MIKLIELITESNTKEIAAKISEKDKAKIKQANKDHIVHVKSDGKISISYKKHNNISDKGFEFAMRVSDLIKII